MTTTMDLMDRAQMEAVQADELKVGKGALATTSQNVPATIPEIPAELSMEGMEGIGKDDLMIPRARVIQPTSKLDGEPGTFHFNLTGECKDAILAVLLRVKKGRVLWNEIGTSDAPRCASDDGLMPRSGGAFDGPCDGCTQSRWGEGKTPPACGQTYNFLGADVEDDNTPFMMSLKGASIKHARRIISAFVLKHKPLYSAPVRILAALVTNDKGKFYEVTFMPEPVGGFDWQPYREMYLGLRAADLATDTEQTSDQPTPPEGGLDEEEIPF